MNEAPTAQAAVIEPTPAKRPGHRFAPGHPKWGGRKKRDKSTLPTAIATCIRMSLDPIAEMAKIVRTGKLVDPDGTKHTVDVRTRVKLLMRLGEHTHSMAPSQVSGALEHQHTHEHFDVTMLMQDPELAQAAESLALALLEPEPGVYQNPVYPKALR